MERKLVFNGVSCKCITSVSFCYTNFKQLSFYSVHPSLQWCKKALLHIPKEWFFRMFEFCTSLPLWKMSLCEFISVLKLNNSIFTIFLTIKLWEEVKFEVAKITVLRKARESINDQKYFSNISAPSVLSFRQLAA